MREPVIDRHAAASAWQIWKERIMENFESEVIKKTSIPLEDGGDTHIHVYGPNENDYVVTTRLPGGIDFHEKIDKYWVWV